MPALSGMNMILAGVLLLAFYALIRGLMSALR